QPDNAQRAVDAKIGARFDPIKVEEIELLDAIDSLLTDKNVAQRVQAISKHIRESKSMNSVVEKIEKVAKNPKIPSVIACYIEIRVYLNLFGLLQAQNLKLIWNSILPHSD
ncbi:UDP-glycosyltransferase 203B2-like protein, partial [Dinothrombium tinctorium]